MTAVDSPSRWWSLGHRRIGFRLTLFFLLLALVPLAVMGVSVATSGRDGLLAQGTVTLQAISQATARQIDGELSEQREYITVLGLMPEVVRYVRNPIDSAARDGAQTALTALAKKARDYDSVAVVNTEGRIILSSAAVDVGTDVKSRPYFQQALKGAPYISEPSVSVSSGEPAIYYSAPIKDESGKVLAIVRSRVRLDGLWDLVEQDEGLAGPGSYGMLLDENGIRLAHSNSRDNRKTVQTTLLFRAVASLPSEVERALVAEERFGNVAESTVQVLPIPEVAAHLAESKSVFQTRADTNAAPNQAAMIKLQTKPWRYLVAAPVSTFTAAADRITQFAAILTVLIGITAVVTGLVLSRAITRPIVQLSKIAERMSLGEMDVKIEVGGKDEIGDLAKAINQLQTSLRDALARSRGAHKP